MRWWSICLAALALAGALACGTDATGIMVSIQPDPIVALPSGASTSSASWDVVVSDLTGVGGTVESIDAAVGGTAVTLDDVANQSLGPSSPQSQLGPFDRHVFHQSGSFPMAAGGSGMLTVTAHFRDEKGQSHQATAQARLSAR
jgi:hypothetical protein